jgi:phosphoglycerol transferase
MIYLSLIIATLLFLSGLLLLVGKSKHSKKWFFLLTTKVTLFLVAVIATLIANYFTGEGFNVAAIWHLQYGYEGTARNNDIVEILSIIALVLSISLPILILRKVNVENHKTSSTRSFIGTITIILAFIIVAVNNKVILDGFKQAVNNYPELSFNTFYQQPVLEKIQNKKNIVYIYAESFERTYFNENVFPGLITEIKELEKEAISFTNITEFEETSWTISGMTAGQCGIPFLKNNNDDESVQLIEETAVCLGDILKFNDYHLTFIGGANLLFSGKGDFYQNHGFDEVLGLNEIMEAYKIDELENEWGLSDQTIFTVAEEKFFANAADKKPFGLFLLTIDTHHPEGFPSENCAGIEYQDGENKLLNTVKCSDKLIAEFIKKIINSEHAKDTIVVLGSDHLMHGDQPQLRSADRKNVFMIIDPSKENSGQLIDSPASTFDNGATLLGYLGYKNTKIGLGRNIFDSKTLVSQFEDPENIISYHLKQWKSLINKLWGQIDLDQS